MDSEVIGVVGHFISAVLQTLGVRVLADVVGDFRTVLISAAYLLIIWSLVGSVVNFTIYGKPKRALYYLVGPALFYFMLTTLVEVPGTGVQFGARRELDTDVMVQQTIANSVSEFGDSDNVLVPLFYAKFDRLVSVTFQSLVAFLVDTRNRRDIMGAARDRVYGRLLRSRSSNRPFLKLISMSLMGSCARQFRLMHDLGENRLASSQLGTKDFEEQIAKRAELTSLQADVVPIEQEVRDFLVNHMSRTVSENPTCEEIWDHTRAAALTSAENVFKVSQDEKDEYRLSDTEADALLEEVRAKLAPSGTAPGDTQKGLEIFAAFYLRNTMLETKHATFASQLEGRQMWDHSTKSQVFGSMSSFEAEGSRIATIYFAGIIPYLQGMLLFALSIIFPFFCILLVTPSHASSFFTWMALWVWVKSWDVGFAIVAIFRDILWESIPNSGDLRTYQNFTAVDWNDPASVFNVVYQSDPLANTYTYYGLVGLLTMAVPYVTAHFCRGASQIFGVSTTRIRFAMSRFQRTTSTSKRTKEGVAVLRRVQERAAAAFQRGMLEGQRNPGYMYGTNIRRDQTADGTLPLHMISKGKEAEFESWHSPENARDLSYLGMLHTRPEPYSFNKGGLLINSIANTRMEQWRGRKTGDAFGPRATPSKITIGDHGGGSLGKPDSRTGPDADGE
jgi:hypothetical protein